MIKNKIKIVFYLEYFSGLKLHRVWPVVEDHKRVNRKKDKKLLNCLKCKTEVNQKKEKDQ